MPYTVEKRGAEWCVYKGEPGKPTGDALGCHDSEAAANRQVQAILVASHTGMTMTPDFLLDRFVSVTPGEPFRLFPFGHIIKGGETIDITPELAGAFRLPHFRPPIKLGGHDDDAPAGGHLMGLEVREDGLYGLPEYTERGTSVVTGGDYRYQSPEVIWEGAGFEDPTTGDLIEGPLIVGVALLHQPHLGEAAALYSIEVQRSEPMSDTIAVPVPFWEKAMGLLLPGRSNPEQTTPPPADPKATAAAEQFGAVKAERDKLQAELTTIKAEQTKAERLAHFAAELVKTSYAKDTLCHAMLAGMTKEQAAWTVTQFKALSAQIKQSALLGELGKTGETIDPNADPLMLLDTATRQWMVVHKTSDYAAAVQAVALERPELYAAAYPQRKR